MDVAATRWRATCCAVAATCGASGQARFPHLPCTSPSSEQGQEPDPGALCACVSVSADGMGDPGQGPRFASGCRTSAPPPPTSPHLPPSCCPRGRPRGEATSIYSPSVPPPASSFLPARLPPAPSRHGFCSGPSRPRAQGRGGGGAGSDRHGVQTEDSPLCAGVRGRPGQKDRMRAGELQLAEACLCLLRALAAPCLGLQEGMRNGTLGECGLQSSPAFGHCGHCGTWPSGFPRVFSATAHLSLPVPSSWLGDCPHC